MLPLMALSLFLLLSKRQKFLARDFAVFDGIDSHLGHLHSLIGALLGYIDIELNDELVSGHKRSAYFRAVHFHVLLPPVGLAAHLINAAHFRRHVLHLMRFHADDLFSVKFLKRLPPFTFAAKFHQFRCDFFCIHISSSIFGSRLFNKYFRRRHDFIAKCWGLRSSDALPVSTSKGMDACS